MCPLLGLLLLQLGGPIASTWVEQPIGTTIDFRNVRAISTQVAWASGGRGTYARTIDGGKTWHARAIPGASRCDFWVHALSVDSAVLVSAIPPVRVYRTTNGGRTWNLQYEDHTEGVRLNGGAFWDASHGVIWGDPVKGSFLVLTTTDGGGVWRKTISSRIPKPIPGEVGLRQGAFAARGDENAWFGTGGGALARVFRTTDGGESWAVTPTRIVSGPGAGVLSIAFRDAWNGVAVGGNTSATDEELSRTANGGVTWSLPTPVRPAGLRETVVFVPGTSPPMLVGVGRAGSVFSRDGGVSWTALGKDAFDSVSFAGPVDAGWAVAAKGRISKYVTGVIRGRSLRGGEGAPGILTEQAGAKPALGRVEVKPASTAPTPSAKHPSVQMTN